MDDGPNYTVNGNCGFSKLAAPTGDVTLAIYNLRGQLVQTLHSGAISAGQHSVVWDGNVPFAFDGKQTDAILTYSGWHRFSFHEVGSTKAQGRLN